MGPALVFDNHYGALRAHELSIDAPAGATALLARQIVPCTSLASGMRIWPTRIP